MALTWKDFVTTLLAALVVWFYWSVTKGAAIPFISGYRAGVIALLVIGMTMCAFSTVSNAGQGNLFVMAAAVIGVCALIIVLYGLITGTKLAFELLTGTILLLWLIATVRHFTGR